MPSTDPMEKLIEAALIEAGEPYRHEVPVGGRALDFYLPNRDIYIEVKQFHSARIAEQTAVAPNVIVAQGRGAVQMLAALLSHLSEENGDA